MDIASFQKFESECKASELTIKAFCQSRNIKPVTYYYWRKRFTKTKRANHGFVELNLSGPKLQTPNIILRMGTVVLEIPEHFSASSLTQILALLREQTPC
jgi:hypothetical protein